MHQEQLEVSLFLRIYALIQEISDFFFIVLHLWHSLKEAILKLFLAPWPSVIPCYISTSLPQCTRRSQSIGTHMDTGGMELLG